MEDKIERVAFLIDNSALISIFEGKNKGKELLDKLNDMKYKGRTVKAVTPLASFLRAIYLADPETKISSIQKTLNFLDVVPSFADFRDEKAVMEEIIRVAQLISGSKNKEETK
jgi:hypothetical protein